MKKTIKKRAFVSAIAMLIVSAIVLTSSTFAWFSMSKKASVDAMDLTVSSPEGIQISANASAWTASLSIDEIFDTDDTTSRYDAYEGNVNLYPADLIPVSSAFLDADSTGFANFYKTTLNDSGVAKTANVAQTAGNDDNAGLIAFDLFFKVAQQTTVYFGTSEFTDPGNTHILTALRVAFPPLGNVAIGTSAADAIALNKFAQKSQSNIVYEVDSVNRSADALGDGQSTGVLPTKYVQHSSAAGATTGGIITTSSAVTASYAKVVTDQAAASAKSFVLNAGITKMRVYIWVEGQDVDCRNSIAGAAFTAALNFTID